MKLKTLEQIIESQNPKCISKLYWSNMCDHYLTEPKHSIEKYLKEFENLSKDDIEHYFWENYYELIQENVQSFLETWSDDDIREELKPIYGEPDFEIEEVKGYIDQTLEDDELYDELNEYFLPSPVSGYGILWLIIEIMMLDRDIKRDIDDCEKSEQESIKKEKQRVIEEFLFNVNNDPNPQTKELLEIYNSKKIKDYSRLKEVSSSLESQDEEKLHSMILDKMTRLEFMEYIFEKY